MLKTKSQVLLSVLMVVLICGTLFSTTYAYDKTYTTYMCGNSHIDRLAVDDHYHEATVCPEYV